MSKDLSDRPSLHVFFFGDSICVGQGVSIHKGWVARVSADAERIGRSLGVDVVVVNASVSGDQTRQALERMPYHIQSQKPDLVIVQFGMNDCNYWATDGGHPRVSRRSFGANLEEIIARAALFGARRVLLHTNHPTGRDQQAMAGTTLTYEESNRQYNDVIREVAAGADAEQVSLIDVGRHFQEHAAGDRSRVLELLLPDLLHLSERGHDLYYQAVGPVIRDELHRLAAEKSAATGGR